MNQLNYAFSRRSLGPSVALALCLGAPLAHAQAPFLAAPSQIETAQAYSKIARVEAVQALLANPQNQIQIDRSIQSENLTTVRFQHHYDGLEVMGSVALYHSQNGLREDASTSLAEFDLSTTPTLSAQEAVLIAQQTAGARRLLREPSLKILPQKNEANAELIYWISFGSTEDLGGVNVMLNAHSGAVLAEIPHQLDIAPIHVYDAARVPDEDVHPITGFPVNIDLDHMNAVVINSIESETADESAKRAFLNSQKTLSYFETQHSRRSFDNKGSPVTNIVHVGRNFANAFWDSEMNIMAYGDGDGRYLDDLTKSLDVAGHELTHGVVSKTANLVYMGESGALNEAIADFFGKMIENEDSWIIGSKLFLDQTMPQEKRGIRNIATPSVMTARYLTPEGKLVSRAYPVKMTELFVAPKDQGCSRYNDYCYVHVNSTIASHATYQMVQVIGKERASKIVYQTLEHRLNQLSDLKEFRTAALKACDSLYSQYTCIKVKDAFQKVGL